ncbi:hypothetical protein C8J57DRAFT_1470559 [Mycena rebaudengoi]|nr:hypothetical protein C8J57DRAFT_1470559 [Mycena rebaudengoi]
MVFPRSRWLEEAYMSDPCLQTGFNLQERKNDVITSTKQTPAPLAPLRSSLTQTTTIPSTLLPYTLIVAVVRRHHSCKSFKFSFSLERRPLHYPSSFPQPISIREEGIMHGEDGPTWCQFFAMAQVNYSTICGDFILGKSGTSRPPVRRPPADGHQQRVLAIFALSESASAVTAPRPAHTTVACNMLEKRRDLYSGAPRRPVLRGWARLVYRRRVAAPTLINDPNGKMTWEERRGMDARTDHCRAGLVVMRDLNGTVGLERDRPWSLESPNPESSCFGGSVRFVNARHVASPISIDQLSFAVFGASGKAISSPFRWETPILIASAWIDA